MDENTARRAAVEFLGGQVQESGFRVGVPISCRRRVGVPGSCRCPRRVRRGLDATASVGVPYDVRERESSPGGSYGTPLGRTAPDLRRSRRGFRNWDKEAVHEMRSDLPSACPHAVEGSYKIGDRVDARTRVDIWDPDLAEVVSVAGCWQLQQ